ncbi:phenylacetic acid degradation protein PaaY [Oceanicola sp. S124]|uniref:phenylacetic acid degradation protein PaaY n=1 Tax=Oceanicola sp. S124 TaxID=1042378 RepID=UPI0002557D35|nr:phenylacetic acid degradation protein PaaY [Oceanicola sp. S124]
MPVYAFEGRVPVVDEATFLHPTAVLIGDVQIGPGCYIGPSASLRGDFGRIIVRGQASVQDNCTMHTGAGSDCIVERGATIGHGAVLHGCLIGDHALVGMNAVVLDEAEIGAECLVAAMSLVRSGMQVGPRRLIAGNPARALRELRPDQIVWKQDGEGEYERLARRSRAGLVECEPLRQAEKNRPRNAGNARAVRLSGKD